MQAPQVRRGVRPAHRRTRQQDCTSSQAGVSAHAPEGTSGEGLPDVGLEDTADSELDGPEGSMCPFSRPSGATTIPDGCDNSAAVDDEVGSRQ